MKLSLMSYQGLFFVAKSVFSTGESRSSTETDNQEFSVVDIHFFWQLLLQKKLSKALITPLPKITASFKYILFSRSPKVRNRYRGNPSVTLSCG